MPETIRPLTPICALVEERTFTFDFSSQMQPQNTIVSVLSITCSVDQKSSEATDPTPNQTLIGAFKIGNSPTTQLPKQAVLQLVGNCVGNVMYILQCVVLTDTGDNPTLWGRLACVIP